MSIQNQKNVQKNRKILKNLLMYDKKNHLFPTPNNKQQEPKKKQHPPQQKKLERKKQKKLKFQKKPKKLKKEQPRNEKQTVKDKKSQDYETFFCLSTKTFCFTLLHTKNQCATLKKKNQKPKRIDK